MGCNRLCTSEDKEAAQRAEKDHISISEARDRIYVERQEMYADIAASMAGARPGESMADVARRHFDQAQDAQRAGYQAQQVEQARQQQVERDRQQQVERDRQQQVERDRQQQVERDRQQQAERDRQQQVERDRQQQAERDRVDWKQRADPVEPSGSFSPIPSNYDHISTMLQDRAVGEKVSVTDHAVAWRDADNRVHHFARLTPWMEAQRADFQKYALDEHPELHRLHALAHMLRAESPYAILYGTERVNIDLQKPLEEFVKNLAAQGRNSVGIFMETCTEAKPGTLLFKSQEYNVHAGMRIDGVLKLVHLFSITIEAETGTSNARAVIDHVHSEFEKYI